MCSGPEGDRCPGEDPYDDGMPVDVVTTIEINRPREAVAAYAADPDNATAWYQNIKSVDWRTPRPARVGSQVTFVAGFLGRRLAYTYEFLELAPGARVVMRTQEGPFPMETTYSWEDTASGATRMTLRNRESPRASPRSPCRCWSRPCDGRTPRTWPGSSRSWSSDARSPCFLSNPPPIAEARYDWRAIDLETPPWVTSQERGRGTGANDDGCTTPVCPCSGRR